MTAPIFDENGALSRQYLLDRGYCCDNGCRNCPYREIIHGRQSNKDATPTAPREAVQDDRSV